MVCLARRAFEGHRQGLDASPLFTTSEVRHEGQTLTLVSLKIRRPACACRARSRWMPAAC